MTLLPPREARPAFTFPLSARRVFRRPERLRPSEYVEGRRFVALSSRSGMWRGANAPHVAGPLDALFWPSVRELVACWPPQTAKSELGLNAIAYIIGNLDLPIMTILSTDTEAREMSRDRLRPMIERSPDLACYLAGADDTSTLRIALEHLPIYLAWGTSVARLAGKPIGFLNVDEEEKFPDAFTKEADPISLARKRVRTFPNYKILRTCSPTIEAGSIWTALHECEHVFYPWLPCPHCAFMQMMHFERLRWPDEVRDPDAVQRHALARYHCVACEAAWSDLDRDLAALRTEWRTEAGGDLFAVLKEANPHKIGFHTSTLPIRNLAMSENAAAFLRGRRNKIALRDWANGFQAEPWVDWSSARSEDRVLALRDDRPEGLVPAEHVACMTAGVDTQDQGFWFEVRAWAAGLDLWSWGVRTGYVETWDALEAALWDHIYQDVNGKRYTVQMVLIDAMGHRTAEVYDWSRQHKGRVLPTKGEQRMSAPLRYSNLEVYPGTRKPIRGGLQLLRVHVTHYKHALASKLDISPADPGAWLFSSDFPVEHARHYTAEYVDDKGLWRCPKGRPNHLFDCGVLNLACADVIDLRYWKTEGRPRRAIPVDRSKKRQKKVVKW